MKVKCVNLLPDGQQAKQLGRYYIPDKQDFFLTLGDEYIVFGLEILGGMPWVELVSDSGYLFAAPLCLFEIVDGRVSQYWEARMKKDSLLLWPTSFYRKYYHDDLLERIPDVVRDFERMRVLIEAEAQMGSSE